MTKPTTESPLALPPEESASLDALLDEQRIRGLLCEGTGRGVRVAVLDTGVESSHPALEGCVRECHEVVRRGARLVCQPCQGQDEVGHGTACAGIIHQHAPEAEIYSVRVIGHNSAGTGEQFLCGLAWALEQRMDVVNLSLGTTQRRFQAPLHELADRAYFQGTILVAAANNYQAASYPAVFASLVAVDNESFSGPLEFKFRTGRPIEVQAQGIYVRAPSRDGGYQLWTGTSFACPHVTAVLARLRSVIPGLTPFQAKALLWSLRANREGEAD